jgi:hypothetical protein
MVAPSPLEDIRSSQAYRLHRRGLVRRYLRVKPRLIESSMLDCAATLAVRAAQATVDPSVTEDELCKLNAAYRHCIAALERFAADRAERRARKALSVTARGIPSLSELLARDRARAAPQAGAGA